MLFSLDHSGLVVFDDSLERHLRSLSEGGVRLRLLTSLSKAWGMGLLGIPCLSL